LNLWWRGECSYTRPVIVAGEYRSANLIRVLVANHPRLIRELVTATISDQPDIEVVGEVHHEKLPETRPFPNGSWEPEISVRSRNRQGHLYY